MFLVLPWLHASAANKRSTAHAPKCLMVHKCCTGSLFIADCCNLQLTFLMLCCMLQLVMRHVPSVKCMIRRLFGSSDVYVAIVYVAVM